MKLMLTKSETQNEFIEILLMNISEYDITFLLEQIQEFFIYKLTHAEICEIAVKLSDRKIEEVPEHTEKLRNYLAFSFDTKVGTELFEDGEELYNNFRSKDSVVSTGIPTLDEILEGGFSEKSLSLFLAETNLGKSLIMSSLASNSVLENKNVLIITLEMSETKYSARLLANLLDTNIKDVKLIEKEDFLSRLSNVKKSLKTKLIIKQYPPKSISTQHIKNLLSELQNKKQFVPDIIFIDYLEIMKSCHATKNDNSFSELKKISEEVRAIAVEYGCPIVSGVQVNRGAFGKSDVNMNDISQSIGVTYTADVIIGVTIPEEFKDKNKFVWTILKNRDGGSKGRKVFINVDYPKMRVTDDEASNAPQPSVQSKASTLVSTSLKKNDDDTKKKFMGIE